MIDGPFPYFGGKRRVAHIVWARFGDVKQYIEPFFGSGAVMFGKPSHIKLSREVVNDLDGFICNFWRALQASPDEVAQHAYNPAFENDLHARHVWLVNQRDELTRKLEGNPEYYDAKVAGWWVWGMSQWIGSEFCSGKGAWKAVDGRLVKAENGAGVKRQLIHLGDGGQGVSRKLIQLRNDGVGVSCKSIAETPDGLLNWMRDLAARLQNVRVCCGDWSRIVQPAVMFVHSLSAVFLDPPYGEDANRQSDIYICDSLSVAAEVREWCAKWGHDERLRIALCGYAGEGHEVLESQGWTVHAYRGYSGMQRGAQVNLEKERIWFSPHCAQNGQLELEI